MIVTLKRAKVKYYTVLKNQCLYYRYVLIGHFLGSLNNSMVLFWRVAIEVYLQKSMCVPYTYTFKLSCTQAFSIFFNAHKKDKESPTRFVMCD